MTKILGFLAVAGLLLIAAPTERAQALSLANPGAAATAKVASETLGMTTEVHWHGWHHRHWHHHYWHRWHHRHWGWRHRHWHHHY
jgi:hypothetical protein